MEDDLGQYIYLGFSMFSFLYMDFIAVDHLLTAILYIKRKYEYDRSKPQTAERCASDLGLKVNGYISHVMEGVHEHPQLGGEKF